VPEPTTEAASQQPPCSHHRPRKTGANIILRTGRNAVALRHHHQFPLPEPVPMAACRALPQRRSPSQHPPPRGGEPGAAVLAGEPGLPKEAPTRTVSTPCGSDAGRNLADSSHPASPSSRSGAIPPALQVREAIAEPRSVMSLQ